MSVPSDVVPVPGSADLQTGPFPEPTFERDEDRDAARVFREINARRALVENPEMLRRLRGL